MMILTWSWCENDDYVNKGEVYYECDDEDRGHDFNDNNNVDDYVNVVNLWW
jgi:hypothetical protein